MPERQSRHADNELIDTMQEAATPSQQGRAGGEVNRRVGTRAEERRTKDAEDTERAIGSDNPGQDAMKGEKTLKAIQDSRD